MKLDFDTDGGIGTNGTLGVIVLETDETLERNSPRNAGPDGTRSASFGPTPATLDSM